MSEIPTLFLQDNVLRAVTESKDGGRYWPTVVVVPSNGSNPYLEDGNYSPDFMALRETLSTDSFRAICQELTALRSRVEELEKELFHWRTIGAEHNWAADGGPDEDGEEIWSEYNADVWDMLSGFVEERAKNADLQRRLDEAHDLGFDEGKADTYRECGLIAELHASSDMPTELPDNSSNEAKAAFCLACDEIAKKIRALLPAQEGGGS